MFLFHRSSPAPESPPPGPSRIFLYVEAALLFLLSLSLLASYTKRYPLFNQTDSSRYQIQQAPSDAPGTPENTDTPQSEGESSPQAGGKNFIKWVDFTVTADAMDKAFRLDLDTCLSQPHLNWIELLAYLGARYGGDFSRYRASDMDAVAQKLLDGESMETLTSGMKYYPYYLEAYTAVLGGMVGTFKEEVPAEEAPGQEAATEEAPAEEPPGQEAATEETPAEETPGQEAPGQENNTQNTVWVTKYGLKAFSPIAKGFPYSDFDDFGTARSYGFKRQHLGHDMMGQVGTPIIATESGTVEALGWNQYGGWRIGIRSFDKKRYYYYAHLRKNYPYQSDLKEGSIVQAGDVIGYMGRTGYSRTENTNNIDEPHLHFGIQLIFDESQKEGNNEIWISCYELVKFLRQNQAMTQKIPDTKEWRRVYQTRDED